MTTMTDDHRELVEAVRAEHEADEHGRCTHCMEWWVEFDSNGSPSRGQAITSAYPCEPVRLADALVCSVSCASVAQQAAELWEQNHNGVRIERDENFEILTRQIETINQGARDLAMAEGLAERWRTRVGVELVRRQHAETAILEYAAWVRAAFPAELEQSEAEQRLLDLADALSVPISERKYHIVHQVSLTDRSAPALAPAICGWTPGDGWFVQFRDATFSMIVCRQCQDGISQLARAALESGQ